jgi:hypothetical protein
MKIRVFAGPQLLLQRGERAMHHLTLDFAKPGFTAVTDPNLPCKNGPD